MQKMKLYASLRSPFARRIRLRLEELGIDYEIKVLDVFAPPPELKELNPLSRVPVLTLPDGEALVDSNQIDEFLRARHASHPLYQWGSASEARARAWMGICVGAMEAIVAAYLESLRHPALQDGETLSDHRLNMQRAFDCFERETLSPFLGGSKELRAWDLDLVTTLAYYELRQSKLDRSRYPTLCAYLDRLNAREAVRKTHPPA